MKAIIISIIFFIVLWYLTGKIEDTSTKVNIRIYGGYIIIFIILVVTHLIE